MLSERKGLKIKVLPVDDRGELQLSALPGMLTSRTKLCCIAQISNVLGIVNPVEEIVRICHANGTLVLVDGAQGAVHLATDVKSIDCDFYAFSGHKMYAAPGTGVLYGKKQLLENLPPYMGGGEMIESVGWDKTTFAPIPRRFEAGTQNLSGVPTFKPAIEMCKLLRGREIENNSKAICEYLGRFFSSNPDITVFGIPEDPGKKIPLFSIAVKGVHHEDLALILDKMGIATRSGQMCAEPLMDRFGVTGMLRISFAPYNTLEEAEYFAECLQKAINMLK
jgi:cysteine desulfurase/selenocysteine lyase